MVGGASLIKVPETKQSLLQWRPRTSHPETSSMVENQGRRGERGKVKPLNYKVS